MFRWTRYLLLSLYCLTTIVTAELVDSRGLAEEVDVPCPAEVTQFHQIITVEMYGNPDLVTKDERTRLQRKIVEAYQRVASTECDPEFTSVMHASIVGVKDEHAGRHLQVGRPDFTRPFLWRVWVGGHCHGCPQPSVFYNEGTRRELRPKQTPGVRGSMATCRCPSGAGVPRRPPTRDEFATELDNAVHNAPEIPHVDYVLSVQT
mmetsp:Transcript_2884/g.4955  ORF Transcript_2884/g.4955 Transcript_2884/m.4955 type:complete len:205 (-) Transcript_2884:33-647(-)